MKDIVALLKEEGIVIAVVGANDHPGKYGHTIYRDLKRKGYRVVPVNPNRPTVDGDPAYASLADLPEKPGMVNIVTPPNITITVLAQCEKLGLPNVWLQPGSEDDAVMAFLEGSQLNHLANACIMVESKYHQT